MKRSLIFLSISILTIFTNCKDDNEIYDIQFNNNSNKNIYVKKGYYYPDTLLHLDQLFTYALLEKYTSRGLYQKSGWISAIESNSHKTLMLFIIDQDTLAFYQREEIEAGYKILKRYDLTIDDLDSLNWTIKYP